MTERETDKAFEGWRAAGEPPEDPEKIRLAQEHLVQVLTQHGYAVCWEMLHQRRLDVVNSALMRIVKSLGKFRGDAKFSTYAHRVFINECKRVATKEGLQHKREIPLEDVPEPTAPDARGELDHNELLKRAQSILDSETDFQFFHYKYHGHPDSYLAERFHLSPTGVRVRWHRIRKKLQSLLRSI